jgi:23S rRNA (cytosine1962-C5)-methyltransferase
MLVTESFPIFSWCFFTFTDMYKKIRIGRGKGYRVEHGHPWVYQNEIEHTDPYISNGEIVDVYNFKDRFIGRAYYNAQSQITARILTRKEEQINTDFFSRRLLQAKRQREAYGYTHNYRLIFGEADHLPGLVIDKFGDYYVVQILTLGMEQWKKNITEILINQFRAKGIYERNDVPVRTLEGLTEQQGFLSDPFDTHIEIEEQGVRFQFDLTEGQKTGFFLDQKENREELKAISKGAHVLDCFTYTGSFALFAAYYGAASVTAYDVSARAIERAVENATRNQLSQCTFTCANAFDVLPEKIKSGERYDMVILDPPAFTKSRKNIQSAIRGYKEINLRGIKLLKPGGFLMTFSCSHFMSDELFYETLCEAAYDSGRTLKRIKYLQQSKDHPVVLGIPETQYLKGYLLLVE